MYYYTYRMSKVMAIELILSSEKGVCTAERIVELFSFPTIL